MNTLIDNVRLWTGENAIDDACIQIKDTRIAYAGARAAAPEFAADTIIDGKGGIALPGLVNAHTHLPMTLVRGVGTDLPLMDWLHKIWPLEDKLTPELMRIGTQMSLHRGAAHRHDLLCRCVHDERNYRPDRGRRGYAP